MGFFSINYGFVCGLSYFVDHLPPIIYLISLILALFPAIFPPMREYITVLASEEFLRGYPALL
jgi:hypothetical protein